MNKSEISPETSSGSLFQLLDSRLRSKVCEVRLIDLPLYRPIQSVDCKFRFLYRAIVSALFKYRFGGLERKGGQNVRLKDLPIPDLISRLNWQIQSSISSSDCIGPFLCTDFGVEFRFLYRPIVSDQFKANCIASSASNIFWLFLSLHQKICFVLNRFTALFDFPPQNLCIGVAFIDFRISLPIFAYDS